MTVVLPERRSASAWMRLPASALSVLIRALPGTCASAARATPVCALWHPSRVGRWPPPPGGPPDASAPPNPLCSCSPKPFTRATSSFRAWPPQGCAHSGGEHCVIIAHSPAGPLEPQEPLQCALNPGRATEEPSQKQRSLPAQRGSQVQEGRTGAWPLPCPPSPRGRHGNADAEASRAGAA